MFTYRGRESEEMFTTDVFTAVKPTKAQSWKNGKEMQGHVRLSCMKE